MRAVVEINNKQYIVEKGSIIYVDYIDAKENDKLTFDKVLHCNNEIGRPYVENYKVIAKVIKHGKHKKIIVLHHIPKKHHVTRHGHRQTYTKLEIEDIIKGV